MIIAYIRDMKTPYCGVVRGHVLRWDEVSVVRTDKREREPEV